jgi:hypothetical protein
MYAPRSVRRAYLLTVMIAVGIGPSIAMSTTTLAASYQSCSPVRVDMGVEFADVQVRNTSCQFGRTFVRANRRVLCGQAKTIRGWHKTVSAQFENVIVTLSKGTKRIRTGACGS